MTQNRVTQGKSCVSFLPDPPNPLKDGNSLFYRPKALSRHGPFIPYTCPVSLPPYPDSGTLCHFLFLLPLFLEGKAEDQGDEDEDRGDPSTPGLLCLTHHQSCVLVHTQAARLHRYHAPWVTPETQGTLTCPMETTVEWEER